MCVVILPVCVSVSVCPCIMYVLVPQGARQLTDAMWVLRIKPRSSGNISQCSLVQSHLLSTKSICFWAAVWAAILEFSMLHRLACLLTLWLSHAVVMVYVIPAWFVSLAYGRPRGFRSTQIQPAKVMVFERQERDRHRSLSSLAGGA